VAASSRLAADPAEGRPKPLAVFAANGTLAVEVRELCEEAGLHVPTQVAIVGIDDYLLSVGATKKYVSGVDTNLEEQGYRGAELLDRLMRGETPPPEPIRIQPAGLIARMSGDILATGHEGVVRALHHIADHFAGPLGVEELAAIAHMSERGLRQAFVKHVGCTPETASARCASIPPNACSPAPRRKSRLSPTVAVTRTLIPSSRPSAAPRT
jgi:LacI family transcriptional regulator